MVYGNVHREVTPSPRRRYVALGLMGLFVVALLSAYPIYRCLSKSTETSPSTLPAATTPSSHPVRGSKPTRLPKSKNRVASSGSRLPVSRKAYVTVGIGIAVLAVIITAVVLVVVFVVQPSRQSSVQMSQDSSEKPPKTDQPGDMTGVWIGVSVGIVVFVLAVIGVALKLNSAPAGAAKSKSDPVQDLLKDTPELPKLPGFDAGGGGGGGGGGGVPVLVDVDQVRLIPQNQGLKAQYEEWYKPVTETVHQPDINPAIFTGDDQVSIQWMVDENAKTFRGEMIPDGSIVGTKIFLVSYDIVRCPVDAICNAANQPACGGSGVDDSVHCSMGMVEKTDKGGNKKQVYKFQDILAPIKKKYGQREPICPTGSAMVVEVPGELPDEVKPVVNRAVKHTCIRAILQAVGPDSVVNREQKLRQLYYTILNNCKRFGIRHVAIPSISAGVYAAGGKDVNYFAVWVLDTIKDWLHADGNADYNLRIVLVARDVMLRNYKKLLKKFFFGDLPDGHLVYP